MWRARGAGDADGGVVSAWSEHFRGCGTCRAATLPDELCDEGARIWREETTPAPKVPDDEGERSLMDKVWP